MTVLITIRSLDAETNRRVGAFIADAIGNNRVYLRHPRSLLRRLRDALRPDKVDPIIGAKNFGAAFRYQTGDFQWQGDHVIEIYKSWSTANDRVQRSNEEADAAPGTDRPPADQ